LQKEREMEPQEILDVIELRRQENFDDVIKVKDVRAHVADDLMVYTVAGKKAGKTATAHYSRWAFTQLLNRFSIPVHFYDRSSPGLKNRIFSEHITSRHVTGKRKIERKLLYRFVPHITDDHHIVRAVLSDRYGIMDDHEVFPVVIEELQKEHEGHLNFATFAVDDNITRLFVEFEDCRRTYNNTEHVAGVLISNSEVGQGAIWIEPIVNIPAAHFADRRSLAAQGVNLRIIHRGEFNPERVQELVRQAREISQVGVVQLAEAWDNRVPMAQALSYAKDIDSMPKRLYDILEEEWSRDETIAKIEAAKKIMELAKSLPLFQRTPLEQAAGRMTGLFDNYQSRIAQIMAE